MAKKEGEVKGDNDSGSSGGPGWDEGDRPSASPAEKDRGPILNSTLVRSSKHPVCSPSLLKQISRVGFLKPRNPELIGVFCWPSGHHNGFTLFHGKLLPQLLGDERHEGVEETERFF